MTGRFTNLAICGLAATFMSFDAIAQTARVSNAETGLVGIKLYDSGQRVVSIYGSPIEVQPVSFGGSAIGPGGGARGGAGGPGGPARGSGGGGQAAEALRMGPGGFSDLDFGDEFLRQKGGPGGEGDEGGPRGSAGGGRPSSSGAPGGAGGSGGGVSADNVVYTRWVYKRGMSKYGFILDKTNRVVQIEAIGMQDGKVKTRKGAGFGTSFATLIKLYGAPDGYDINGDTIVMRFLQRSKVAFRLNRLAKDKPHQVTGVVVAGGKQ